MIRTMACAAGMALLLAGAASAQDDGGSPEKQAIVAKLETMKVTVDFRDTPLPDVIDFLRDLTGINFVISPTVMDRVSQEDLTITLKVKDLVLKTALKLMLKSRGLTATYRDGVLMVVTEEELQTKVTMQLYDVRDLLMKVLDFPGPQVELKPPGDAGGPGGATFSLDEEEGKVLTEEFIEEILRENTGSGSWDSNPNCSIVLSNGILIVVQTPKVHGEILNLLGKLRQFK